MKTKQILLMAAIILAFVGTSSVLAQPGQGYGNGRGNGNGFRNGGGQGQGICQNIPNLTEEQQTKIETLKTAHLKEMTNLRNKMGELRAKQRTLTSGDVADQKTIDANIDDITKLQNTIMKSQAAHRADIRKLLTDEQKVWFDNHPPRGNGHNKGYCQGGKGAGQGRGPRN